MKPLTWNDKLEAFTRAVCSFAGAKERWQERSAAAMSDEELAEILADELGIAGGSGCRDSICLAYQGAGLKIWASRDGVNPYMYAPIFEGRQTIAMARQVFGIRSLNDNQMDLFL